MMSMTMRAVTHLRVRLMSSKKDLPNSLLKKQLKRPTLALILMRSLKYSKSSCLRSHLNLRLYKLTRLLTRCLFDILLVNYILKRRVIKMTRRRISLRLNHLPERRMKNLPSQSDGPMPLRLTLLTHYNS